MQFTLTSKPINKAKVATTASYKNRPIFVKKQTAFEGGNMTKECLVVAADSLFNKFKNKT